MEIKNVLTVTDLAKQYVQDDGTIFNAVNNISCTLAQGEILGLLGPNGAGKTTTIHMLFGLLTPTSGSITYFGKNFYTHRSAILQQVGFATAYAKLPPQLRVKENLDIFGRLYGLNSIQRAERIAFFLKKFDMESFADKKTGALSAGQMTRLVLAKAFLARPRIVLLDEPTASLDPDIAQEIRAFVLQERKEEGVSFLFTSHNMTEVTQVCDRVLVLRKGEIIADSSPEKLARTVRKAYVSLLVGDGLKRTEAFAKENTIEYMLEGRMIRLSVDQEKISELLTALAHKGVSYSEIVITQPSLEDYFLQVARSTK